MVLLIYTLGLGPENWPITQAHAYWMLGEMLTEIILISCKLVIEIRRLSRRR